MSFMARLMKDRKFREDQVARLHEPHMAPITKYVHELRASTGWVPYVAPLHGGVEARILSILRDPGPATQDDTGSGMLCLENNDQTAERQCALMTAAGLTTHDITPWNAYPWYINRAPTNVQLHEGAKAIVHLVGLMPELQVVLLQGREAQRGWDYALEADPSIHKRRLVVIPTYHPSIQALRTPSLEERERRIQHRIDSWKTAASSLRS